jgi:hypothetical protein
MTTPTVATQIIVDPGFTAEWRNHRMASRPIPPDGYQKNDHVEQGYRGEAVFRRAISLRHNRLQCEPVGWLVAGECYYVNATNWIGLVIGAVML